MVESVSLLFSVVPDMKYNPQLLYVSLSFNATLADSSNHMSEQVY